MSVSVLVFVAYNNRRRIAIFLRIIEKEGSVKDVICRNCGTAGLPLRIRKGDSVGTFFEVVFYILWLNPAGIVLSLFGFFLIPIGFTVYRNTYRYSICRECRKRDVVPLHSPVGKELQKQFSKTE